MTERSHAEEASIKYLCRRKTFHYIKTTLPQLKCGIGMSLDTFVTKYRWITTEIRATYLGKQAITIRYTSHSSVALKT